MYQPQRDKRHPDLTSSMEEAVVAWNAPQPFHPEAKQFVAKSLSDLFGSDYSDHFHHTNKQISRVPTYFGGAGKVVGKHAGSKPRLPSAFYG